jgi:hypothetical protein
MKRFAVGGSESLKVAPYGVDDHFSKLSPCIALRGDGFSDLKRREAAIFFLRDIEGEFSHG